MKCQSSAKKLIKIERATEVFNKMQKWEEEKLECFMTGREREISNDA